MFLEVQQEKLTTTKLKLKDINVFKKFMNEGKIIFVSILLSTIFFLLGKASIKFNSEKCSLYLSNAPPGSLIFFLKTLFIKMNKDSVDNKNVTQEEMHKKLRAHLLSEKFSQFDEISPVTNAELDRAKKMAISKSTITTPSPPRSKKRRLIDASNTNPKAAKQLYAPSPLSIKQVKQEPKNVNPDDPAMMEILNEEQNKILQGRISSLENNSCRYLLFHFLQLAWAVKVFSSLDRLVLESLFCCAKSS